MWGTACAAEWSKWPDSLPVMLGAGFLQRVVCRRNLDQWMYRRLMFLQQAKRFIVAITRKQRRLHGGKETAQRAECRIHRRSFVAAVDHTIRARRIAGLGAVVAPVRG